MEKNQISNVIPQAQTSKSVPEFIRNSFQLIKNHVSNDFFLNTIKSLDIKSRVTYNQIIRNKRHFPKNKIPTLATALDLSFSEKIALDCLAEGYQPTSPNFSQEYVLGSANVLSHPIHTMILNLCGLNKKMKSQDIVRSMNSIFPGSLIHLSIELLLKEGLLVAEDSQTLVKTERKYQLSVPSGVRLDHAKQYLAESFDLMKKNYDLPLNEREYTAFTAKIKKEDFIKLKDLVRDFRKSVYELSSSQDQDAVVQVVLGSFILNPEENDQEIV
ncbi:MAG: DUF4423 domain-containing protein [Bdellovibrionota bacterium]